MQARMSDEFLDAIDWQKLKENEALQKIENERRQLDLERSKVEYEKGRVYWEQEEERRRLHWEWSQLNDASMFQAEKFQFEDQKRRQQQIVEEKSRQDWEWKKLQDETRYFEKRKDDHVSSSRMFQEIKGLKKEI